MSEEAKFEVIIIGAGPAGIAAALTLVRAGVEVVVLDRGKYPGAKNLFGGILFTTVLNKLIPNFWEQAPIERYMTRKRLSFLTEDAEVAMEFQSEKYKKPPFNNSMTVLRAKFDQWFAKAAEDAGAQLFCDVVVDDFVWDNNKIIGVKTRGAAKGEYDILNCDVVINAEGANSMLAEKAGLRKNSAMMKPENRALAVKEILSLPEEVVLNRFNLTGMEGVSMEFFGESVKGMRGYGFLYTNRSSISIGIGCMIQDFNKRNIAPYDILNTFKEHPCVAPYIRGTEPSEYSAHMIPEESFDHLPPMVANGLILVGDAAGLVQNSLHHEGTNLAMASGVAAAETILEARKKKDYSSASLSLYTEKMSQSFAFKDMKHYHNFFKIVTENDRFLNDYPKLAIRNIIEYFTVDERPKEEIKHKVINDAKKNIRYLQAARDFYTFYKDML
jgi:electron transfer flavoprotein-quinone oxidoreductase